MKLRCRGFISELQELKFCKAAGHAKNLTFTVRTRGASGPRDFVPSSTRSLLLDSRFAQLYRILLKQVLFKN